MAFQICCQNFSESFLPPGVNFINVLRSAFTRVDPKSAKMTVKGHFALLGSTHVKAMFKHVGEIEPR